MTEAHDDLELGEMDYEERSEDWRLHLSHAFDADPEEIEQAQRFRALGFFEPTPGRWIGGSA